MVSGTLSESTTSINTFKTGSKTSNASTAHPYLDQKTQAQPCEGSIAIRMGLSGLMSTEIIAHESATEERLREVLKAARPLMMQLQEILIAFGNEEIGVTH